MLACRHHFLVGALKEQANALVEARHALEAVQLKERAAREHQNRLGVVVETERPARGEQRAHLGLARELLHRRGLEGGRRGLGAALAQAVGKALELELLIEREKRLKVGVAAAHGLKVELERHMAVDGGELIAQKGRLAALGELLLRAGLDRQGVEVGVDVLEGAPVLQEGFRRLLADAGHAGDVVGGVALERLEVDHAPGLKAVDLDEFVAVVAGGLAAAHGRDGELDRDVGADELQIILVAGDDDAVVPRALAARRDGADDVVGLVALQLQAGDVHGVEHLLEHGQLRGELVGHAAAARLVLGELLVAKRRPREVERDAHGVGGFRRELLFQNVQKAVDGVGEDPVAGRQQTDAGERAVDDAVAVKDE